MKKINYKKLMMFQRQRSRRVLTLLLQLLRVFIQEDFMLLSLLFLHLLHLPQFFREVFMTRGITIKEHRVNAHVLVSKSNSTKVMRVNKYLTNILQVIIPTTIVLFRPTNPVLCINIILPTVIPGVIRSIVRIIITSIKCELQILHRKLFVTIKDVSQQDHHLHTEVSTAMVLRT